MKIEGDEKLILADASLYRSIAMSLTSRKTGLTLLKPSIVSHMKEPRCEHATSQEIRSVLHQESKMRTDMCTTAS